METQAAKTEHWTITVADGEGDTATVTEHPHDHIRQLLRVGLRALYGEPTPNPDDYDVVVNGTVADPDATLAAAGLHDHAEALILPKDVSRG